MSGECRPRAGAVLALACLLAACSSPDAGTAKKTTVPTYDKTTGKLTQLTYDRNGNGIVDTWTEMDGSRPLRSRIDLDEDGIIDRWEYYDASGTLVKVGFARAHDGKVDAWAYARSDGSVERIEISSAHDENKIDRWEHYDPPPPAVGGTGPLAAVEEDGKGDGRPHKWETYASGALVSIAFDEDGDGRPDRRLLYRDGVLVVIESAPDASGAYTRRVDVK